MTLRLVKHRDEAKAKVSVQKTSFERMKAQVENEARELGKSGGVYDVDVESLQAELLLRHHVEDSWA